MALIPKIIADLIAECFALRQIHRYAHICLRYLAKDNGFASALGQKCFRERRRLAANLTVAHPQLARHSSVRKIVLDGWD